MKNDDYKVGASLTFIGNSEGYFIKGEKYSVETLIFDHRGKPVKIKLLSANMRLTSVFYDYAVKNFLPTNTYNGWQTLFGKQAKHLTQTKDTNPKDAVGIRKWRQLSCIPSLVLCEIGVAMLEGALKYGRHNYRVAGVRASVYIDAAQGHIIQFWEGEDLDPDTKLSHVTKAITSLIVLRDSMIQDNWVDDRPPKAKLDKVRDNLQGIVDEMMDKYPEPVEAFTELNKDNKR